MDSWGGRQWRVEDFGAWYHLFVGTFTLIVCLVSRYLLKGVYKNLNILVGLVLGYLMATVFTVSGIAPSVRFFISFTDDFLGRIFQPSNTRLFYRT